MSVSFEYDENTSFTVEGSNTPYVAAYGNNLDTSYIKFYANSQSNAGYIFGISNYSDTEQGFIISSLSDFSNSNSAHVNISIVNSNIGIGGIINPKHTVDIIGDINFTRSVYKNETLLPVDSWMIGAPGIYVASQYVTIPPNIYTTSNIGIGTHVPLRPLHVYQGATGIPQQYGEAASLNGSLAIMHGVNDSYRFISALDNSMKPGDLRYISFGKTISMNNEAELSYMHVGDGSAYNYLGLGLYGGAYLSVTANGNVGIGITTPASTLVVNGGACVGQQFSQYAANSDWLLVSSNIGIGVTQPQAALHTTGQAIVGSLLAHGDITSFKDLSDSNLKMNYTPLTQTLAKFQSLQPVEFDWKSDIFNNERAGTRDVGLIAQAVENVLPHVVGQTTIEDTTYKTIRYEKIIPYLVQAVKELTEKVESLETRLSASSATEASFSTIGK
jgi:Chaperone of endosialidase